MSVQSVLRLSLVRNESKRRLSKLFFATSAGIAKDGATKLARGEIRQWLLPFEGDATSALQAFAQILVTIPSEMALALGIPKNGVERWQPIVSEKERLKGALGIRRSQEDLGWPPGAGLGFFDCDEGSELLPLLDDILPSMGDVAAVVRPSSSAGVFNPVTGEKYGRGGEHVYVVLSNAERLPDVLFAIRNIVAVQRPELIGFREAKDGKVLERGPIDLLVGSPERLIYEGAPLVMPPLLRGSPALTIRPGGILDVDALVAFSLAKAPLADVRMALRLRKITCGFAVADTTGRVIGVRGTTRGGSIEREDDARQASRRAFVSERQRLHECLHEAHGDIERGVRGFLEEATAMNRTSRAVTAAGFLVFKGWPDREIKAAIGDVVAAWKSLDERDLVEEFVAHARTKQTERRGIWLLKEGAAS